MADDVSLSSIVDPLGTTTAAPVANPVVDPGLNVAAPDKSNDFYAQYRKLEGSDFRGTKPKNNKARLASYVIGAVAVAMLVTSILMLVLLRTSTTVITSVVTSAIVSVSVAPLPEVKLQALKESRNFSPGDIVPLVSPVTSVADVTPVVATVTPSVSQPHYDPGEVPFPDTIGYPLISPPEGFGWCAITPDGSQWFTSFENGYSLVGQYIYTNDNFQANSSAYKNGGNEILSTCANTSDPTASQQSAVNTNASAVGSVGYASIAISADGQRLYVAYRQATMGSQGQLYPFLQLSGAVGVFTRPANATNANAFPTSTEWTYSCDLSVVNPYGAQVGGFDTLCDPITHQTLMGDDFGSIVRTTTNLLNGNRVFAVRANYGSKKADGALIGVWEEGTSGTNTLIGIVQLFEAGTTFTLNQLLSFGRDFNIGNDALLASVRVPAVGCNATANPPFYKVCTVYRFTTHIIAGVAAQVAFFRRNFTTANYEFQHFITAPSPVEDFGVSVVMNPTGTVAVIGAPTLASPSDPGIGGSVYVYVRSADGASWNLNQSVPDPMASTNTKGAFGYFLSVDSQFLVLAASANQNNVISAAKVPMPNPIPANADLPKIEFISIDQESSTLDTKNLTYLPQQTTTASSYLDPTFGAHVAMAFVDQNPSQEFRVLVSSAMNQSVSAFVMTA